MLKLHIYNKCHMMMCQPPSGGCVLKLKGTQFALCIEQPAAFGRLCVETAVTMPK